MYHYPTIGVIFYGNFHVFIIINYPNFSQIITLNTQFRVISIIQESDLKERLEEMKIKRDEVTIASFDAISMYPCMKLATIRKAVRFFARKLTVETNKTINLCLKLIHFVMSSTLIPFYGNYYEYNVGDREEQGLTIGEYESAF